MGDSQFCLAWDTHNKNICSGLSSLQQNGEFVDMTLAADGHMVKVHQMVMALASPYIKELISSAQCPHPVIFLNRVSYTTLCSILEYIYTGQTYVALNAINELITAAKELHIKGLEDVQSVNDASAVSESTKIDQPKPMDIPEIQIKLQPLHTPQHTTPYVPKIIKRKLESAKKSSATNRTNEGDESNTDNETIRDMPNLTSQLNESRDDPLEVDERDDTDPEDSQPVAKRALSNTEQQISNDSNQPGTLFAVTSKGSLQLLLNRYLYYLLTTNRNGTRRWRCINRCTGKCMAQVVTRNNVVLRRLTAHNHGFHDKKILKIMSSGTVYSTLNDADKVCEGIKEKKGKKGTRKEKIQNELKDSE